MPSPTLKITVGGQPVMKQSLKAARAPIRILMVHFVTRVPQRIPWGRDQCIHHGRSHTIEALERP